MLLNKLGYDLPGNAFSVVAGDLTIRKLEFGSVTAKLTLWDRTGPTKKWKWSSHFLWEPVWVLRGMANTSLSISWGFYCEGESLPGGVSSCCTLHGHKSLARENPKAGCIPWEQGDKAERINPAVLGVPGESCKCPILQGPSCSAGWISCSNLLAWEWAQDLCPCVHWTFSPGGILPQGFIHPPQSESSGLLPFTRCLGHPYPEKHHKNPSPAWERSTSVIPTFPRMCSLPGMCLSPPPLSRGSLDLLRADTSYVIKGSQNAAWCSHSVCLDHKESQVITLNVRSTE